MASLSLSSIVQVFPCPNCRETINTSIQQCWFCSTTVDCAAVPTQTAAATSKISQACSDASYLKIMSWALLTFVLLLFIPFLKQNHRRPRIGLSGYRSRASATPIIEQSDGGVQIRIIHLQDTADPDLRS